MLPAVLPSTKIVRKVSRGRSLTVREICGEAGVECRVTGPAAERRVYLRPAAALGAEREPGPLGAVSVGVPKGSRRDRAILALGVLAYSAFDYASRESARGLPEMRSRMPAGRPREIRPLSGAERQRRYREKVRSDSTPGENR
jgi:hypothetical protein